MEALYGLLDDAGDDAEGNITLFINMRHHKGYLILFPDCPAVIAGVGNGIDTDGEPDKDGAFMDVFHSSGVFSLNLTFFHVSLLVLPSTLLTSAWTMTCSGESARHIQDAYQDVIAYLEAFSGITLQSKDRSLARMEVSTPKISARTTFSATAMTLACTIRSS